MFILADASLVYMPTEQASKDHLGPISASPQYVAEALVEFASLTAQDTLFDLGCNDGRIVITAARLASLKAVGIEIDRKAAIKAQQTVNLEQLQDRVTIISGNALEADISSATVVFMYLLPMGMSKLIDKLQAELQPGCRVVTYMFRIADWQEHHQKSEGVSSKNPLKMDVSAVSKLHLYHVPQK